MTMHMDRRHRKGMFNYFLCQIETQVANLIIIGFRKNSPLKMPTVMPISPSTLLTTPLLLLNPPTAILLGRLTAVLLGLLTAVLLGLPTAILHRLIGIILVDFVMTVIGNILTMVRKNLFVTAYLFNV